MKKITLSILAILIGFATFFTACTEEDKEKLIAVLSVALNQTSATMPVGSTLTLVPTILPENASNLAIAWVSTDTTVARVANGVVNAIKPGTATISAITIDGGKTASTAITVIPIVPVTSVILDRTIDTLAIGDTRTLIATVLPDSATNKTVEWSSSNNNIATVLNGVVTAVSVGSATITVTTADGNKTATCEITVITIPVTGVTLNKNADTLALGETLTLITTVLPTNATNKNVTWSSSNTNVATVVNGEITTLTLGSATITATTQDGNFTDTTQIIVSNINNQNCNMRTPGWGNSLGTVTRGTQEWTISGNGITQIWSDAVTATNCQKTTFNGGTWSPLNFNADCRSNPGYPGDLFSWCAVVRFQDELCPAPWRVPTTQDFRNLDIAMGGSGNEHISQPFVTANYITRWGGAFGGNCLSGGTLDGQGSWASYWSQTEGSATSGRTLDFSTGGSIWPQFSPNKGFGFSVRCVR